MKKCTEEEAIEIVSRMEEFHLFEKYVNCGLARDFLCTIATHIRDMQMDRLLEQERFLKRLDKQGEKIAEIMKLVEKLS